MSDRKRARALREQGFTDGQAGRRARWPDIEYQQAWRHGQEDKRKREATREERR